ncbi:Na+/H+ antiporter family protein [Paenalkalicoccus suaedae]|uniref:Na+/H+ antiporter family protein n=1 Tax=Paenalkalicoccus suaedae TaxID=2592382 RepID=A0A859FKJ5_9BACI|nr:Na+/H+ antiporter family protein [Paenalkalicoccus suaedae]QKS73299.1 Na+/H+ antiporter family protein [Paenalkalicoccus suaedae]
MNAVIVAVLLMIILSLFRVHVVLALAIGAFAGGLVSGMSLQDTITAFQSGLEGGVTVALSYGLLGAFAVGISYTGLPKLLVEKAVRLIGKQGESRRRSLTKVLIVLIIALISSFSQNLIPIHIAFIPILIPPLLYVFNELKLDRRATATALTFGLKAPYLLIPAGYGLVFQEEILVPNLNENGMNVSLSMVPQAMLIPVSGMLVGLLIAIFISYKKPREYEDRSLTQTESTSEPQESSLFGNVIAVTSIVAVVAVQITTNSMLVGSLTGIIILYAYFVYLQVTKRASLSDADTLLTSGMKMLAFIGFIMITAGGFAEVIRETGHVELLVDNASGFIGDNRALAAIVMLVLGLFITMGIGSSFATIPIIAVIFVPLATAVGFSPMATIALIGTAAALGDAGSPASDSTLGPTAGLNADGQHNHIWDTCVPTFLHFNIPLIIFGFLAAMIL